MLSLKELQLQTREAMGIKCKCELNILNEVSVTLKFTLERQSYFIMFIIFLITVTVE